MSKYLTWLDEFFAPIYYRISRGEYEVAIWEFSNFKRLDSESHKYSDQAKFLAFAKQFARAVGNNDSFTRDLALINLVQLDNKRSDYHLPNMRFVPIIELLATLERRGHKKNGNPELNISGYCPIAYRKEHFACLHLMYIHAVSKEEFKEARNLLIKVIDAESFKERSPRATADYFSIFSNLLIANELKHMESVPPKLERIFRSLNQLIYFIAYANYRGYSQKLLDSAHLRFLYQIKEIKRSRLEGFYNTCLLWARQFSFESYSSLEELADLEIRKGRTIEERVAQFECLTIISLMQKVHGNNLLKNQATNHNDLNTIKFQSAS